MRSLNTSIFLYACESWTVTAELEEESDDKQHQWHEHRDQNKRTEAWDCYKLQVPWLSYNWWGFQAWDALKDSKDNSSIVKAETSLEWQVYFS